MKSSKLSLIKINQNNNELGSPRSQYFRYFSPLCYCTYTRSLFMWKQNSLRGSTSKFEQDVLEPKDHLLMLIAAAVWLLQWRYKAITSIWDLREGHTINFRFNFDESEESCSTTSNNEIKCWIIKVTVLYHELQKNFCCCSFTTTRFLPWGYTNK